MIRTGFHHQVLLTHQLTHSLTHSYLVPKFFVWDSWTTDLPCGFRGPSSLFQRWNFQVRNSYGLLEPSMQSTNKGTHCHTYLLTHLLDPALTNSLT